MTTAVADHQRRRSKAHEMRERGEEPFPHYRRPPQGRSLAREVLERHQQEGLAPGAHPQFTHRLCGRLIDRRRRGRVTLLDLRDRSGRILLCARDEGSALAAEWDIGDFVEVAGCVFVSDRGQVGLEVLGGSLLVKALRLPPSGEEAGLQTQGRRELELIADDACRERYGQRSAAIAGLREWMGMHEFIEVETPILQPVAGGALARPFVTHHNALDVEASLRISAELYLRRFTVGDLERVFDVGKRFRNEGISRRHSPEFTMFEWLMAYTDHRDAASFTEGMVAHMAMRALGTTRVSFEGNEIDLAPPWRRITLREAISEATGLDMMRAGARELLATLHEAPQEEGEASWSEAVHRVYGQHVEPKLIEPTFVLFFPVESRPCVKRHPEEPGLGESFDVVIGGMEVGSGGTAIDDPDEQWQRFCEQSATLGAGEEPHPRDADYVEVLQYGAPPAAGSGIGIDRLLMVMLGAGSISDVVSFGMTG